MVFSSSLPPFAYFSSPSDPTARHPCFLFRSLARINTRVRGVSAANPQASGVLRSSRMRDNTCIPDTRRTAAACSPAAAAVSAPSSFPCAARPDSVVSPLPPTAPRRAHQSHLPYPQHAQPFPIAYSRVPSRTPPPVFPLATRSFPSLASPSSPPHALRPTVLTAVAPSPIAAHP
ncbi:hypothetical protein B0H13DRAFT_1085251 [Mycena leptocephala]|nr:hypothetical protein B0H13DRAFT_1085251 [Mycena leptocephala]